MTIWRFGLHGLLLTTLLTGCSGGGGAAGKPKVGFVTNNPEEFWKLVEAGGNAQAEKDALDLDFRRPPRGTAAEQVEIINAMLAKGVKGISISVQDPRNQTDFLNEVAAKVALLAVDNDAPKSQRKCYIGTNNVKAGREVGKLIKEAKPKGTVLALFVGQLEPDNARERIRGVLEELGFEPDAMQSKDGKYRLHRKEPFTDGANSAEAKNQANVALAQMAAVDDICLVGLWAYNPPAILAAVREQGLAGKPSVTIVGFDEDLNTLKGIDEGLIYGTVVQNPYEFGRKSVEIMGQFARGEKPNLPGDGLLYIPERVVTREGPTKEHKDRLKASEYYQEVKKLLGK